jgi:hypothetical protein
MEHLELLEKINQMIKQQKQLELEEKIKQMIKQRKEEDEEEEEDEEYEEEEEDEEFEKLLTKCLKQQIQKIPKPFKPKYIAPNYQPQPQPQPQPQQTKPSVPVFEPLFLQTPMISTQTPMINTKEKDKERILELLQVEMTSIRKQLEVLTETTSSIQQIIKYL